MSLAVLIPYRPDTLRRRQIFETTQRLWARLDVEVCVSDDGLEGAFSYARASNRARRMTDADVLLMYNTDALPLPQAALDEVEKSLADVPWSAVFDGQQRFTGHQTIQLINGVEPAGVGPPAGEVAMGREALLAVRADVWDDLRGMDERFIGWGPEDKAWHHVLRAVHPTGNDTPKYGLFQSLQHPTVSMASVRQLEDLYAIYPRNVSPAEMRAWYLSREVAQ